MHGFRHALAAGADLLVQMDCDFSHPPAAIPGMLETLRRTGADMVAGSRYVPGGRLMDDWPLARRLLSAFANSIYLRLLLGIPIADATGGFRLWRRETLLGMGFGSRVASQGYVFQVEMASLAHRLGYRILELPITFSKRRAGRSKMNVGIQIEAAWRSFQVRRRHSRLSAASRCPIETGTTVPRD